MTAPKPLEIPSELALRNPVGAKTAPTICQVASKGIAETWEFNDLNDPGFGCCPRALRRAPSTISTDFALICFYFGRIIYPVDKNRGNTWACLPGQPGIQIQPGKQITKITKITKYELWKLYKLQNKILKLLKFSFVQSGMDFDIIGVFCTINC